MMFVRIFERLLDSLDSSGGHIALLLLLMVIGIGMLHTQIPKGEDVMAGAFGALLLSLKTAHSNHTRHKPDPPA